MDLPHDDSLRDLISRYAAFRAEHGEAMGKPELVLPTGEFFPDEFRHDPESVAGFFQRMLSYAPVASDLPIALRFVEPEDAGGGKSCNSGACGSGGKGASIREGVTELNDGYGIDVNVGDVSSPTLLSTTFARSVGDIVLYEAGEEVSDRGTMCEIVAVACGFGALLANGSYVYAKGCGGVRVHQATRLAPTEIAFLLALFLREHDLKPSAVRSHLDTTPREAFDAALALVDSNPDILAALRNRPEALAAGFFTIEPVKGLLGRLFARRRAETPDMQELLGKG